MKPNLIVLRRDAQKFIDEDPDTVVLTREPRRSDVNPETQFAWTGRIVGSGIRGTYESVSPQLKGEDTEGRYGWAIIAPWDIPGGIHTGDELRATNTACGTIRVFRVIQGQQYNYKWEALIDLYQP